MNISPKAIATACFIVGLLLGSVLHIFPRYSFHSTTTDQRYVTVLKYDHWTGNVLKAVDHPTVSNYKLDFQ